MSSDDLPTLGLVVAAGGTGVRFGHSQGKQLAPLFGRTVLEWALDAFMSYESLRAVTIAAHPDRLHEYRERVARLVPPDVSLDVVAGGDTRQESVLAGLEALPTACDLIAVHDGARPLLTAEVVVSAVKMLAADEDAQGVVVGHPSVDTLKHVSGGVVVATPDRTLFWSIQTPQIFKAAALRLAHERARVERFAGTDDASLVERLGGRVLAAQGPRDNIKVTHAEDLLVAEAVLAARSRGARSE